MKMKLEGWGGGVSQSSNIKGEGDESSTVEGKKFWARGTCGKGGGEKEEK